MKSVALLSTAILFFLALPAQIAGVASSSNSVDLECSLPYELNSGFEEFRVCIDHSKSTGAGKKWQTPIIRWKSKVNHEEFSGPLALKTSGYHPFFAWDSIGSSLFMVPVNHREKSWISNFEGIVLENLKVLTEQPVIVGLSHEYAFHQDFPNYKDFRFYLYRRAASAASLNDLKCSGPYKLSIEPFEEFRVCIEKSTSTGAGDEWQTPILRWKSKVNHEEFSGPLARKASGYHSFFAWDSIGSSLFMVPAEHRERSWISNFEGIVLQKLKELTGRPVIVGLSHEYAVHEDFPDYKNFSFYLYRRASSGLNLNSYYA